MDRKVEGVAVDTRVLPDKKAEPMGSDEVSEINIDKLLEQSNTNLPEIKEEKHVTLTAGGAEYQKTSCYGIGDGTVCCSVRIF